jgi:hypothetical protein
MATAVSRHQCLLLVVGARTASRWLLTRDDRHLPDERRIGRRQIEQTRLEMRGDNATVAEHNRLVKRVATVGHELHVRLIELDIIDGERRQARRR